MKSSRCINYYSPFIPGTLRVGGDGDHYWAVRGVACPRPHNHEHHHRVHSMDRDCHGDGVCRGIYTTPRLEIGGTC